MISLRWKRFANSEEFKTGLNTSFELVKKYKLKKWFANLRDMSFIHPQDQEWVNTEWFPRLIKLNFISKMALVYSLDYFNQVAVNRIMTKADPLINFEVEYFNDISNAEEWLKKG